MQMSKPPSVIAVLDDEPKMRKALRRLLSTHGFRLEDYECGEEYLAALPSHRADCLVLDLHMPKMSGFEVLAALAALHVPTPVVVITGHGDPDAAARVFALGASEYLTKPVEESALLEAIHKACARAA